MSCRLAIKRVYLPSDPSDGLRVLVDRLWPRGLSRERAAADEWRKDLAPSPALRSWFGHQPERFGAFAAAYRQELDGNPSALDFARRCRELPETQTVTLLYGARDPECNHAVVLHQWLTDASTRTDK